MATVKTIKPDGTGDYTTLQAWEDWADGEANAGQWAECYAGGNLGALSISGWAGTPDGTNFPKVYTPTAERHDGSYGSGAYIESPGTNVPLTISNPNRIVIDGLRLRRTTVGGTASAWVAEIASGIQADGFVIENCLIEQENNGPGIQVLSGSGSMSLGGTIRNNIIVENKVGAAESFGISVIVTAAMFTTHGVTLNILNNTIVSPNSRYVNGIRLVRDGSALGSTANLTVTAKNNVAMGAGTADFVTATNTGTGVLSMTASHNASSDATSDDWGATGAQNSLTASSQFVNVASDWNLKAGANLIDTGTDLSGSSVTTDYSGTVRSGTYDIGADEYVASAVISDHSNRSLIPLSLWI